LLVAKYSSAQATQEGLNLSKMSLREIINKFRNPNMLKTNSEDYLTYIFKQNKDFDLAKVAASEK